ncbi:kynureninase [Plantibacter sp. CFBP 13570]|uniref:kynureninase n=1 Tax=Plantibacter sp. CFBP 13570 TaxID=2775272 RepID=UPI001930CDA4|nr:aminotransferase class V-fold PLP-dependent enzyme [Plantibacter sp. CFBP 13570]MBD8533932.1 aminotransferase class V-fold PLP-dependent enzyme [Plantibacter sp. CFBP 13570]
MVDAPAPTTSARPDARVLDETDPLAEHRAAFVPAEGVVAYLDGNSLGRPLRATAKRLQSFIAEEWGTRLIRSWDDRWFELPLTLGDRLGSVVLGAAAGQTVVADSTTVLLYKLIRAAVDATSSARGAAGRDELVIDAGNFPTDRFVIEGIAAERGLRVRWIDADPVNGVAAHQLREVVHERTALVVLSQVDYRSGALLDVEELTAIAHQAGALVLWDLCHSAGAVPIELDEWSVDLAVGCSYKYLGGGPGAPAFAYVAARHQGRLLQPIQGWMGAADVFAMADAYQPAVGMRRFLSGTPPIVGMLPLEDSLTLIESAGVAAIRAKSVALTTFAISWADEHLAGSGVRVMTPRDAARRGGHVTLGHPSFREITPLLWNAGVIPDFRHPDGLRIGVAPLSSGFAELELGLIRIAEAVHRWTASHGSTPPGGRPS